MTHLGLPHPKQMAIAVPANLCCGRPDKEDMTAPKDSDWAPLSYTFAGIWEVQPEWVAENAARVQVIDVREPDEYVGALGHIEGAKLIPLGTLIQRKEEIAQDPPVVVVCRSGARSAQATVLLRNAGYVKVANLAGGMLRWRGQRLPAVGGTD